MSVEILNYLIPETAEDVFVEKPKNATDPTCIENLGPYQKLQDVVPNAQICIWYYMEKAELSEFLKIRKKAKIRETIENKLNPSYPNGAPRSVLIELIYNVAKFCKSSNLSLEQTGVVLSIFLLTHKFFISNYYTSAEKVYNYFKEFILTHSVSAPPDNIKLFCYQDSKKVLNFFCTIYLRNLPLIRLLVLPNYGFVLDHKLEPEYDFSEKKSEKSSKSGKKDKQGKKNKKKGKKK